jgi:hypothetical protein
VDTAATTAVAARAERCTTKLIPKKKHTKIFGMISQSRGGGEIKDRIVTSKPTRWRGKSKNGVERTYRKARYSTAGEYTPEIALISG